MNICFVTKEKLSYNEAPPSRIINIAKILERYHDVFIISQKPGQIKGHNIYEVPKPVGGFLGNQLFKVFALFASIYQMVAKKIDFFIVREYYLVTILYPFTKLFGSKILYDMHCFRYKELYFEEKKIKSILIKPLEILARRLAYKILSISQGIIDDLPEELREKTILLPNGVDIKDFDGIKTDYSLLKKYNIPKGKPVVGFLGNWMEWVDIPTFLQSSKYIKNTTLVVVGEGYQIGSFSELKKAYTSVAFTGRIDHKEAIQLLKLFDICVLPYKKAEVVKHLSIRKTFEYLAAGKPIIMSDFEIGQREFLKENKNILLYEAENSRDLASKIALLLRNKKLMDYLGKNNKALSQKFSWEQTVLNSQLLNIITTYDLLKKDKLPESRISVIIKAFNEEKHISDCIKSALNAFKGLKGEVILVDSKSNDKTLSLAKKHQIKIIQLNNEKERRCGIGPQIGFLYSKGNYIYILDGDMVLDENFIKKALPYFNDNKIAGVGGNIIEKSKYNLAFQVRSKFHHVAKITEVNQLGMGGIYKKEAIEDVGYLSNPYLFAYEEYDLGAKLRSKGYRMLRIPEKMVEHYGDEIPSLDTLKERWKSGYLFGSGQYLKAAIKNDYFLRAFKELKIYIITLIWILFGLISIIGLRWSYHMIVIYSSVTFVVFLLLLIKKRSLKKLTFSFASWNLQSLVMVLGFLKKYQSPIQFKPDVRVIK